MKKILTLLLLIGVLAGGWYLVRILPAFTTDNSGAEKVVLLHGFGRNDKSMLLLESALAEAGYDVYNIPYPSVDESPERLVEQVGAEIDACCAGGAETVHFVGHSFGGLLIRAYLADRRPASMGRVVLLGSPNKGTELSDSDDPETFQGTMLELAGPTARALGTGPDDFPASLPPPDYEVGVVAGTKDSPVTGHWLPVPNDGVVSVESAKLEGMSDFVTVDRMHWVLRSDPEVAALTVRFLRAGRFQGAGS